MESKKSASTVSAPVAKQVDPVQIYERAMRNVRLAHRHKVANGKSAWGELVRAASGDGKDRDPRKLAIDDASALASKLYVFLKEVEPRLKQLGISRGELCRRARFTRSAGEKLPEDAKELYRLTLPPNTDARKREIRVGAEKYVALIDVVTRALGDNVELVADRLLRGTSLHRFSKSPDEWSDLEKVQSRLQRMVDDLDREFDLTKAYRRTAELKCRWITEGGHLGWPLYDVDHGFFGELELSSNPSAEQIEEYLAEHAAAADLNQAYYRRNQYAGHRTQWGKWWLFGFQSHARSDDEFFFVPHAPLGHVLMWDLPDRREDRASYDVAVKRQVFDIRNTPGMLVYPNDDWDETRARPAGQTAPGTDDGEPQYICWLLAYPHPVSNALVPTLYQPLDMGGSYMLPLDMDALEILSNAVWVSQTDQCSVIEWLKAALINLGEDGFDPIERNLRRTAPWLLENPILKQQRENEDRSRRLDDVFRAESRPMARRSSAK
jgi:hypothetical protein